MSGNTLTLRDGLLAVMVMAIWGSNFTVTKVAVEEMPPILLVAIRFLMVAVLMVPFVKIPRGSLKGVFLLAVVLGAIHFPLMFYGLKQIDSAIAAITVQIQVPFAAILGWLIYRERIGWRRIGGMVLAFMGVLLIAGEPQTASNIGALLMVVSAVIAWSFASLQMKELHAISVFQLNGWMAVFAAPMLFALSFLIEGTGPTDVMEASTQAIASAAYMAVFVVIIGYGLWANFMKTYRSTKSCRSASWHRFLA